MQKKTNGNNSLYRTLSLFFGDVSVMIESAMAMSDIVASLADDAEGSWGRTLTSMVPLLEDGATLSEAMEQSGGFPAYAIRLTASGEQSGRLEEVTEALSLYYDSKEQQRSLVESAMVQPLILLSLLAVIMACFIGIILPVISGVYRSLGGQQGGWISAGYIVAGIAFALLAAAMVFLLSVRRKLKKSSMEEIGVLSRFPATEKIIRKSELASFMSDFATRVSGGIFTDLAFASAAEALRDGELKDKLTACSSRIAEGESLSAELSEADVLPSTCMHMITSGIRNGKVEDALSSVSEILLRDARTETENLVRRIEPSLTGFFTVMVGISLLSVMLPLIGVITSIG